MQPNLTINIGNITDDYQVVTFNGEFDKAGYGGVKENLDKSVKEFPAKKLVFDFTNLKFINSEGIGYLMEIHTHLVKQDKKFIIIGLNQHVKDVFNAIGINNIVPIYNDLTEFLNK